MCRLKVCCQKFVASRLTTKFNLCTLKMKIHSKKNQSKFVRSDNAYALFLPLIESVVQWAKFN